jgi:hypothetical protein
MNRRELIKSTIVLCCSLIVLLLIFTQVGSFYARSLFPLFRWQIKLLAPEVESLSLNLGDFQGQHMVSMVIKISGVVTDRPKASKTITIHWPPINLYIHAIIIFSMLAAWPGINFRDRVKLLAIGVPFLILAEMLDVPLLTASRCKVHAQSLVSQGSPAVAVLHEYWLKFLNSGGREFLSILAGFLAVAAFYLLKLRTTTAQTRAHEESGRNDPCPCGSGKKYKKCCMGRP